MKKDTVLAVIGTLAALAIYTAYRQAQPGPLSATGNTPANAGTSSSVAVPAYATLFGIGGLIPLVSFPDTRGTSANITQPV